MTTRLLFFFLITFAFSCSKSSEIQPSEEPTERTYPLVDERLWPYFRSFEDEASERGHAFDLRELNINGAIETITEQGVAGYCEYGSHIDNQIAIDDNFWNRASDAFREFVVYHELGHCVLHRGHDETTANGICQSIMRSGTTSCNDNYNTATRPTYIDELFSEINAGY